MDQAVDIALRAAVVIGSIIMLTRLQGLRSFSKLSGFDFATTVAVGSVLAGAVTTLDVSPWVFVGALAALFAVQIALTRYRIWRGGNSILDNAPVLVMENGELLQDAMARVGLTETDLMAKLREANAFDLSHVHAVIVETTGDVSVLHGPIDGPRPDTRVMRGVRRIDA